MREIKIFDDWNDENILAFEKSIESDDMAFKEFNARIVNTPSRIIGVRIPELHKTAKEIARSKGADGFISLNYDGSFELTTLRGLVIAYMKNIDISKRIELLDSFIDSIDNWATVDVVSGAIKINSREYEVFLENALQSFDTWRIRFGVVSLMSNFMLEDRVNSVLQKIANVRAYDDYYVDMAIAWAISVAYVRDRAATEKIFEEYDLSERVLRKSVSKICDSRRVGVDDKKRMKERLKERLARLSVTK